MEKHIAHPVILFTKLISFKFSVLVFCFYVLLGCGSSKSKIIEGTINNYRIPSMYIRNASTTVFGGKIYGDNGSKITSFKIPASALKNSLSSKENDYLLSGLIFWERNFDKFINWTRQAEKEKDFENLYKIGVENGLHAYKSKTSNIYIYYYSFDINKGLQKGARGYSIIKEMESERPLLIDGKEFKTYKECEINFIYDGMLFQMSPIGRLGNCNVHYLPILMRDLEEVFSSWVESKRGRLDKERHPTQW